MLVGDDKRRDRTYAHFAAVLIAVLDVLYVGIRGKQAGHNGSVHASAIGNIGQNFNITNVAGIAEIGLKQPLHNKALKSLKPRPMDKTVGVDGVGCAFHPLKIDLKPNVFGVLNNRRIGFDGAFFAAKFALKVFAPPHAFGRHCGVKLKGVPFNFKRVVAHFGQSPIKVGFADIAPRANRVRKDIKFDHLGPLRLGRFSNNYSVLLARQGGLSRAIWAADLWHGPFHSKSDRMNKPSDPSPIHVERANGQTEAAVPLDLGQRVRALRQDRNWTLEQASQHAGLARSTLSKIENGQMSPTYDALKKLAVGLNISVPQLFTPPVRHGGQARLVVTPADAGEVLVTTTYEHRLLGQGVEGKAMLPYRARIRARSFDDFDGWVRHDGEEFLYVLTGVIRLFAEGHEAVDMRRGDSAYYDAAMGHNVVSISQEDATVLWVTTLA